MSGQAAARSTFLTIFRHRLSIAVISFNWKVFMCFANANHICTYDDSLAKIYYMSFSIDTHSMSRIVAAAAAQSQTASTNSNIDVRHQVQNECNQRRILCGINIIFIVFILLCRSLKNRIEIRNDIVFFSLLLLPLNVNDKY